MSEDGVQQPEASSSASKDGAERASDDQTEIPVLVAVHIRPLIHDELMTGCRECLTVADGSSQVCCGHHTFNFDQVYGGGGVSPSRLYPDCIEPLVQGVFNGYNATVFAYGQTGSGKTYTMGSEFTPHEPPRGVIPDCLSTMFAKIAEEQDTSFTLRVGFIEIHKEEIHDLLLEPHQQQPAISIREMPNGSMCVAGATEIEIDLTQSHAASQARVLDILMTGSMSRATSMTMMNARSSRSHAIFSLTLEQRRPASPSNGDGKGSPDLSYLCAKMLLVDLAGSERVKRTQATGARLQEGIHINQGLLSLANVIQALVDGHKHVPYRNSKLTRLLQDSLGHNSRTAMIACVSPADSNLEETINTLRYANRARNIKNKPVVNRDPAAAEILLLRQQLAAAHAEIAVLRGNGAHSGALAAASPAEVHELKARLADAQEQLLAVTNRLAEQQSAPLPQNASQSEADTFAKMMSLQRLVNDLEAQNASTAHTLRSHSVDAVPSNVSSVLNGNASSAPSTPVRGEGNAHDHMVASPTLAMMTPVATPGGRPTTPRVADAHAELVHRLTSLQQTLQKKESQVQKLLNEKHTSGIKAQYERVVSDMIRQQTSLQAQQASLQKKLKAVDESHSEEKKKAAAAYRKQLKELEEQVARSRKDSAAKVRLEGLMRKSEEVVNRLKADISRMKNQKSSMLKQMSELQQSYETFKRGKAKEITVLKKGSRRAESEARRLALLNEKQKAVLQRKIREAEEARKRLNHVNARRARTAPRPSSTNTSSTINPTSAAHPANRPFSLPPPAAVAGTEKGGESGAASGALRPNPAAPLLDTPEAIEAWLSDEIEAASTAHLSRTMLEAAIAERTSLYKDAVAAAAGLRKLDGLPPEQQAEHTRERTALVEIKAQKDEAVNSCHSRIAALQGDIEAAIRQNNEARDSAARFSSVKDPAQAQQLLSVAFKIACNIFDAAEGFKATNAELTDTEDALQAELDALKHRNVSLETDLATTRAALARANAAAASAAALARPRSADSHSSSPQPLLAPSSSLCTSPSASMHADRHVLRRTLSDESDAEARTSGGLSRDSGVVAGVPRSSAVLPAIAEERSASAVLGRAKADAPSLDDLDGLFKELMHDYATHTTRPAQRSSVAQPSGPPSPAERPRTKDTNGSPNCSVLGPLRSCFGDFDDLTRPLSDGGAPSAPAAREPAATEPRKNHLFHTNAVYDSSSGSDADGGRASRDGEALAELLPHGKYPRVSLGSMPPPEVQLNSSVGSDASVTALSVPGGSGPRAAVLQGPSSTGLATAALSSQHTRASNNGTVLGVGADAVASFSRSLKDKVLSASASIKRARLRAESSYEQLTGGPSPTSGRSSQSTRSDRCPHREEFPQLPPLPKDLGRATLPSPSAHDPHVFHNILNTNLVGGVSERPLSRAAAVLGAADKGKPFRPASFGKGPAAAGLVSDGRRSASRVAAASAPQTNGRHAFESGIVTEMLQDLTQTKQLVADCYSKKAGTAARGQ